MKKIIQTLLTKAFQQAVENGDFSPDQKIPAFFVEPPKDETHGDFYTNISLVLAKPLKMQPRDIAGKIVDAINRKNESISKIEIAGPGFINFFMTNTFWLNRLHEAMEHGNNFGRTKQGNGEKILVEFVSANPTGPLHVGHGRGAIVGDVLASILDWAGYDVQREYYINDVGLQMNNLGLSVFTRYKQQLGQKCDLPEDCYKGEYIKEIADEIFQQKGDAFKDASDEEAAPFFSDYSCTVILKEIRNDLKKFGIEFDSWYSEKKLFEPDVNNTAENRVTFAIKGLQEKGLVYEKDDALWLKASEFGDEKDRVVKRGSGIFTYFASDIAYHNEKIKRGFQKIINVWGADHHGYVPRLRAAIKCLDFPEKAFLPVLIQLVNLKKGDEIISMSTRGGKFLRLSELIDEVGKDATRFFFLTRSYDAQLDFDINLAKSKTSDNPIFYIQYAHARICSILRQANETAAPMPDSDSSFSELLSHPEELVLIKKILALPDLVNKMASRLEPHLITYYLQDLASEFHRYYNKHRVITEDNALTKARLFLIKGIGMAIKNSLEILGIDAPEKM